jgi:hypothetical protein
VSLIAKVVAAQSKQTVAHVNPLHPDTTAVATQISSKRRDSKPIA